jgi:hypothetical protein
MGKAGANPRRDRQTVMQSTYSRERAPAQAHQGQHKYQQPGLLMHMQQYLAFFQPVVDSRNPPDKFRFNSESGASVPPATETEGSD